MWGMYRGYRVLGREWLTHCQDGRLHRAGDGGRGWRADMEGNCLCSALI